MGAAEELREKTNTITVGGAFSDSENTTEEATKGLEHEEDDAIDESFYEENLSGKKEKALSPKETFERGLASIGSSSDEAFDIIMEIANNGYFEKNISLFKGAVKATFRSSTLTDASLFLESIEEADLKTESRTTFFLGLFVLGAVLHSYNGKELDGESITDRVDFIKKNIPPVFFKALKMEAARFSELNEIIGSEGAADFF